MNDSFNTTLDDVWSYNREKEKKAYSRQIIIITKRCQISRKIVFFSQCNKRKLFIVVIITKYNNFSFSYGFFASFIRPTDRRDKIGENLRRWPLKGKINYFIFVAMMTSARSLRRAYKIMLLLSVLFGFQVIVKNFSDSCYAILWKEVDVNSFVKSTSISCW